MNLSGFLLPQKWFSASLFRCKALPLHNKLDDKCLEQILVENLHKPILTRK